LRSSSARGRGSHSAAICICWVAQKRFLFHDRTFDLVVSYLRWIDIPDIDAAIPEMARVLAPGSTLLVANLTNFNKPCADRGWVTGAAGERLHSSTSISRTVVCGSSGAAFGS
jgi:SAM-dependent methyltransferase